MGWSSWNHFGNNGSHCHCTLGAAGLMETADAFVSSGLRDAGYKYVNMDGCDIPHLLLAFFSLLSDFRLTCRPIRGWAIDRSNTTGELLPDPYQFPASTKQSAVACDLGVVSER